MIRNKLCTKCGKDKVWKSGLCSNCIPKKPFKANLKPFNIKQGKPLKKGNLSLKQSKKGIKRISSKQVEKNKLKIENTKRLHTWFQELYDKHPTKRCEECDKYISTCNSINWHHLIPKSRRPDLAFNELNIIFLCGDCHSMAESNLSKVPIVKQRTEVAKYMFNKIIKEWDE